MNQSEFADPGPMQPVAWMSGSPTKRIPKRCRLIAMTSARLRA